MKYADAYGIKKTWYLKIIEPDKIDKNMNQGTI